MTEPRLRLVEIYQHIRDDETKQFSRVYRCDGLLHCFSTDHEMYEDTPGGVGNFPVAIVELAHGKVESVPANDVEFLDVKKLKGGGE